MPTTPQVSPAGRTPPPRRLLRPAEVAALLAITTRTVRALADRGDLRRVKLSARATRYELEEVETFIAERTASYNDARPADEPGAVTTSAGLGRHAEQP